MSDVPSDRQETGFDLDTNIAKESVVYNNLGQEIIQTTSDRIKICLLEHRDAIQARGGWIAPLGVLIAIATAFVTADFRAFLGVPAATWQAVFILGLFGSTVWLIVALINMCVNWRKGNIDAVVEQIKTKPF